VEITFGADGKQRMLKMVDALETSLDQDIRNLPWMTEDTKKQAKVKLQAIRNKIGYPDLWRDYSFVDHRAGRSHEQFSARPMSLNRSGRLPRSAKPLDRKEWG